jgi:hypothetical protein
MRNAVVANIGFGMIVACLLILAGLQPAQAVVPGLVSFQGHLTDDDGLPLNGDYDMTFFLFNADLGGSQLWTETQLNVAVADGIYNVQLGAVNALSSGIFDSGAVWLEVVVEGEILSPRQRVIATAYALKAQDADALIGNTIADLDARYVQEGESGVVSSAMIADGTVGAADLGANSVGASEIGSSAVGTSEVADSSLTAADLAPNSVGSSEVIDNSLTAIDLAANSVGASEIATGAVGTSEVADNSLTTTDIYDGPGSLLNADYLDGYNYSAFVRTTQDYGRSGISSNLYEGTASLTSKYVNETGDSMTGQLSITNSGTGLFATANTAATTVYGVRVDANQSSANNYHTYGLYSDTDSAAESGYTYGTYSNAAGSGETYGLYSYGNSTSSTAYGLYAGGYGQAGTTYGIYSYANQATGNNSTVYGYNGYAYGQGTGALYGSRNYTYHYGSAGTTYGNYSAVYGSDAGDALGVYGYAHKPSTDTAGTAYGGRFSADNDSSGHSYGLFAEATGAAGTNIAVRGIATGVGYNYAIYGSAAGGTAWAGYFGGPVGIDADGTGTDIQSVIIDPDDKTIELFETDGSRTVLLDGESGTAGGPYLYMYNDSGTRTVWLDGDSSDGAYIALSNASGSNTIILDADYSGDGRIITQELQITGGSDLSEQFDIQGSDVEIAPGMVVSIDPDRPGHLSVSDCAYDNKVAGIISGAGGIKPGMMMGQAGTEADGQHPVALTGRVYCWADATGGAIQPGDLLTTADRPGHAMKVTDHSRANGAILGKAMTALDDGTSLVLVLVSLQ